METRTPIMQRFIDLEITKALVNSQLRYDHAMRETLNQEAVIVGQKSVVRVLDHDGNWVLLEKRIEQLKSDPRYRESIPNPAKVTRSDELGIRDSFDQISKGTVVVE